MLLAINDGIALAFPNIDHLVARVVHPAAAAARRDLLYINLKSIDAESLQQGMHVPPHETLLAVLLRQVLALDQPNRLLDVLALLVAQSDQLVPEIAPPHLIDQPLHTFFANMAFDVTHAVLASVSLMYRWTVNGTTSESPDLSPSASSRLPDG